MPKVSVIIPTHNRSAMLRSAIESVLSQSYQDFEIIVVDDCSKDDTQQMISSIPDKRVRYICHEVNKGVAGARNTGVVNSVGEYIAFLDDDDRWLPQKLQLQIDLLEKSPTSMGGVYTGFLKLDLGSGRILAEVKPVKRGRILVDLYSRNWIGTASTVVLRRSCFDEIGLFDEAIDYGEEYDMWIRIAEKYEFEFINIPLVHYSVHQTNISTNSEKMISGIEAQLRKYKRQFATDRRSYSHCYLLLGVNYCYIKNLKKGRRAFLSAIWIYPFEVRNYYNLLISFLGAHNFKRVKELKGRYSVDIIPRAGSEATHLGKVFLPDESEGFKGISLQTAAMQLESGDPSDEKYDLDRRPRLLFLARPFPPCQAIGSVRAWNIAKYLTRMGWDVTVVTPHPHLWRDVYKPEGIEGSAEREGIRLIFTGHRWRYLCAHELKCWNRGLGWILGGLLRKTARYLDIDSGIGWIGPAERACSNLSSEDADVILATGPPFAPFKLARRLSQKLGRPYVLDYRDPWTENPHAANPFRPRVFREEERLLAACAAVTVVSPSWASAMNLRFRLGSKLNVVTNGYDSEDLDQVKPFDFGHRAIVYTGGFYSPKRSIAPLMAALKRIKDSVNDNLGEWYFHYYGNDERHVREEALRFDVGEKIRLHGQVPRTEALSAVKGAQVAVVVASVLKDTSLADTGIVPAKVYEALGLRTTVLLVAPFGSDARTVAESSGAAGSFRGDDIDGIASFLLNAIHQRSPGPRTIESYSWTDIAKKLDHILYDVALPGSAKTAKDYLERSLSRVE